MNHDVQITELGQNGAAIYIDGHELRGVTAYTINRTLDSIQRVTFTILAENVSVLPVPDAPNPCTE